MSGEITRAAGLIVFRVLGEFQYLLLQASDGIHHWTPPKGHVDPGEDAKQTAKRETEEESGLSETLYNVIEDFHILLEYQARGKPKKVDYWLAHLINPETPIKLSHEHQDFKWVNAVDAIKMTHNNMADPIAKVEKYLQTKFKSN